MKSYQPQSDYAESQRRYNWKHSNGKIVNQDDLDKSAKIAELVENVWKENYGSNPTTGLVLGCRTGYEVEALADQFENSLVVGVDIVPEFIARACKQVPAACMDMHELNLNDKSVDFTVCNGTLEHCWNPDIAMREIQRVTRHLVYITVDLEEDRDKYKSHYSFSADPAEWLEIYNFAGFQVYKHWIEASSHHDSLHTILIPGHEEE